VSGVNIYLSRFAAEVGAGRPPAQAPHQQSSMA
jgi:hypothetical protein